MSEDSHPNNIDMGEDENLVRQLNMGGEEDENLVKPMNMGGEEDVDYYESVIGGNEFIVEEDKMYGGEDRNEFIVGDEYENKVLGGYHEYNKSYGLTSTRGCLMALLVVAIVLVLMKILSGNKKQKQKQKQKQVIIQNLQPIKMLPKYHPKTDIYEQSINKVLLPSSYFDFDAHGMQYINWG